jgi:LemA protein
MKKSTMLLGCLGIILLGALILALALGGTYNSLVSRSQAVDSAWAQVENVYQRRADLIPNLVATVSGDANFEKSTLIAVTDARASVGQVKIDANSAPTDPAQLAAFQKAQDGLGSALSRLLVVSENYPTLKATAAFQELQSQLEGSENRIAVERRNFNDAVQSYDTAIQQFPGMLVAGFGGFKSKPYFSAQPGAETTPKVDFNSAPAQPAATK